MDNADRQAEIVNARLTTKAPAASAGIIPVPNWRVARDRVVALLLTGESRVVVVGPPGTGKTTLLRDAGRILAAAGWNISIQLHVDILPPPGAAGTSSALFIDEADRLGTVQLSGLCDRGHQAVLLAGLDTLTARFRDSPHVALTPWPPNEAKDFIHLWLAQAGHTPGRLHDEAVEHIAELSGGVPRLITTLLVAAIWTADFAGEGQVRRTHVEQAAALRNIVLAPDEADTLPDPGEDPPALAPVTAARSNTGPASSPAQDAIPDPAPPAGPEIELESNLAEVPVPGPIEPAALLPDVIAAPAPVVQSAPTAPAPAPRRRLLIPVLAVAGLAAIGGAALLIQQSPARIFDPLRRAAQEPAPPSAPPSQGTQLADTTSAPEGPPPQRALPPLEPAVVVPAALAAPPEPMIAAAGPVPTPVVLSPSRLSAGAPGLDGPAPPSDAQPLIAANEPRPVLAAPAPPPPVAPRPAPPGVVPPLAEPAPTAEQAEAPPPLQPPPVAPLPDPAPALTQPAPSEPLAVALPQATPPPVNLQPATPPASAAVPVAPPVPSDPIVAAPPAPQPPSDHQPIERPGGQLPVAVPTEPPPAASAPQPAPEPPAAIQPPARPPVPPPVQPPPSQAAAPPPAASAISPEVVALLLRRGNEMLAAGDVSAARLLFGRAAAAGSGTAMIALGLTFDPVALGRARSSLAPDPAAAALWFRRAMAAGHPEAAALLQRLARGAAR